MRFSTITALAALLQYTLAFQSGTTQLNRRPVFLSASTVSKAEAAAAAAQAAKEKGQPNTSSSSTSGSSGNKDIQAELASGKVLEGGKVIDFEAVKGPSRAEQALAEARQEIINQRWQHGDTAKTGQDSILGINDDVIQEVGHPLGTFATSEQIQRCAKYLRSQAPPGLLKDAAENAASPVVFSNEEEAEFRSLLEKAYQESGEVTGAFAKTFYMGTMLLPEAAREAIWAIYVWCRRTDEIVDAPRDDDQDMLRDLSSWEMLLEQLWGAGAVKDVYDLCLLDVRIKYPAMSITPFMDMIRGMLMDVPGLGQDRYETFDELHLYCYRVAGTVGLMSLPIFGTAPGVTYDQARWVLGVLLYEFC